LLAGNSQLSAETHIFTNNVFEWPRIDSVTSSVGVAGDAMIREHAAGPSRRRGQRRAGAVEADGVQGSTLGWWSALPSRRCALRSRSAWRMQTEAGSGNPSIHLVNDSARIERA
jgi:hypothetical protein